MSSSSFSFRPTVIAVRPSSASGLRSDHGAKLGVWRDGADGTGDRYPLRLQPAAGTSLRKAGSDMTDLDGRADW